MRHIVTFVLLLASSAPLSAQTVFIAPTPNTVRGSTEQAQGPNPGHVLYVTNSSTVPIVVFGVAVTACENVRRVCAGERTNILVHPNGRREVGRVEMKDERRSWNYRWTFSYRADSSNALAVAALRENGYDSDLVPIRNRVLTMVLPPIDTTTPPGMEKPLSHERITAEERTPTAGSIAGEPRDTTPAPIFRFKVAYGSILGSTMMPGAAIQRTGPCVDPALVAVFEKDAKITRTPWRPPVMPTSFAAVPLPMDLRDSVLASKDVLVRFVADTTGAAIPTSVSVLESPHGLLSASVCTTTISARATTPARDKTGKAIRAWVQVPVRVGR